MLDPLNILLIENSNDDIDTITEIFDEIKDSPYFNNITIKDLIIKKTFADAMEYLDENHPDIIFLDITLPDTYGLSALRKLEHLINEIPVLIISDYYDSKKSQQALQMGVHDFLVKFTLTDEVLYRAIRYALERHKLLTMLKELALVDEVTNFFNKRGFITAIDSKLRIARRDHKSCLLFIITISNLNEIKENFGIAEKNNSLILTSECIKSSFRDSDTPARLTDDTFVVLAFRANENDSTVIQERIRNNISDINKEELDEYDIIPDIKCITGVEEESYDIQTILEADN